MKVELLRIEKAVKYIGDTRVLDDLRINIYKAEIVLALGMREAGQQMLAEVVSGRQKLDSGIIYFNEEPVELGDVSKARELGIYGVFHDTRLVPDLTVAENMFVIRQSRRHRVLISRKAMISEAKEILRRVRLDIPPDIPARLLSPADQHLVEIARDVAMGAKLIVNNDFRTSYTHAEIVRLKDVVRILSQNGISFLIASTNNEHPQDTFNFAHRIVVMRDGRNVRELHEAEFNRDTLAGLMVGREFFETYQREHEKSGEKILQVEHLQSHGDIRDISFHVESGEIVGLLDLGQRANLELAGILAGEYAQSSGDIFLTGNPVKIPNIAEGIQAGIAYVPEFNMDEQLSDALSAAENLALMMMRRKRRRNIVISRKKLKIMFQEYCGILGIPQSAFDHGIMEVPPHARLRILYMRWILAKSNLMVAVKPTSSLDVVMAETARAMLDQAARSGMGVLVISSDLSEATAICDRLVILKEGKVKTILTKAEFSGINPKEYY